MHMAADREAFLNFVPARGALGYPKLGGDFLPAVQPGAPGFHG